MMTNRNTSAIAGRPVAEVNGEFAADPLVEVNIPISQAHLDAGVPGQECRCALALAFEERFPGSCPDVMYHHVICRPKGQRLKVNLTAVAVDFVSDFDHRRRLGPTSVPVHIRASTLAILESAS